MFLNGLTVAASLLQRGEDGVFGKAEVGAVYGATKAELSASRERTGCYSMTRMHLNKAAELLGINPTDFKYRVSPALLDSDTGKKRAVSGAELTALGGTASDPDAIYNLLTDSDISTSDITNSLANSQLGTDIGAKDRMDLLMAQATSRGSVAAALLACCDGGYFARYRMKSIETALQKTSNWDSPQMKAALAITHVSLAVLGALATGAALTSLRNFVTQGVLSTYREERALATWIDSVSMAVVGKRPRSLNAKDSPVAQFTKLTDAAIDIRRVIMKSPLYNGSPYQQHDYSLYDFTDRLVEYTDWLANSIAAKQANGEALDNAALVSIANRLLASTPQLVRGQA